MHIIYVDDEKPAIDNFRLTVKGFNEIKTLNTFQDGEEALKFAEKNIVDAAFLDMEMPGIHGLELCRALKKIDSDIRVIFVTAFGQYALEAFGVDASGYLLKPYTAGDIRKELYKCTYKRLPSHRVVIKTIPSFSITVDGAPLFIAGSKPRELLALLVDRGEKGVTVNEAVACLWPDRTFDTGTQSLCRMTWKRLCDALESAGIGNIVSTSEKRRYLKTSEVDCDLYRILSGDKQAAKLYGGAYLQEYEWAEERNFRLKQRLGKRSSN